MPGQFNLSDRSARSKSRREAEKLGRRRNHSVWTCRRKRTKSVPMLRRERHHSKRAAGHSAECSGPAAGHRHLLVRIHVARPLRSHQASATFENDATLKLLADSAVSHVRAGADMVAPSDMMDGRVAAIRGALDREGFSNTPIMAYSAKVRFCVLRTVSEAAGLRAAVRRPPQLSDGSTQCAGSHAGDRAGYSGRRGHRHGQTRDALSRYHLAGARPVRRSSRRISGQRRILDDRSRGASRMDRSRTHRLWKRSPPSNAQAPIFSLPITHWNSPKHL